MLALDRAYSALGFPCISCEEPTEQRAYSIVDERGEVIGYMCENCLEEKRAEKPHLFCEI